MNPFSLSYFPLHLFKKMELNPNKYCKVCINNFKLIKNHNRHLYLFQTVHSNEVCHLVLEWELAKICTYVLLMAKPKLWSTPMHYSETLNVELPEGLRPTMGQRKSRLEGDVSTCNNNKTSILIKVVSSNDWMTTTIFLHHINRNNISSKQTEPTIYNVYNRENTICI